jgi:glycosyltransferase involved in cell wall biosynthesis
MKILITDIHHGNGGGHVTYVLSLLKGLKSHCDLTLAAPQTGRLYKNAVGLDGVRVLPGLYTSRPLNLVAEVLRLRRFLVRERFDLIHVNGSADHRHIMLARLGLRHRPAIVWTKHNTTPVDSPGHRLRARFGTDATIAVSDHVGQILASTAYGRRPIHVIRNGIDTNLLRPADAAEKAACRYRLFGELDESAVVLGSTGGTDYNKGWLDLIKAVSHLEPSLRQRIRVVVAGDMPSATMLAQVEACQLQKQVVFPGLVSNIRSVFAACDIGFVLSYREAASYAAGEAMAMGLPALVSDAGGLPENVRDNLDGWVVPAGEVDVLAQRLRGILHDAKRLASIGCSARTRAEGLFAHADFLRHTHAVYGQATLLAQTGLAPI